MPWTRGPLFGLEGCSGRPHSAASSGVFGMIALGGSHQSSCCVVTRPLDTATACAVDRTDRTGHCHSVCCRSLQTVRFEHGQVTRACHRPPPVPSHPVAPGPVDRQPGIRGQPGMDPPVVSGTAKHKHKHMPGRGQLRGQRAGRDAGRQHLKRGSRERGGGSYSCSGPRATPTPHPYAPPLAHPGCSFPCTTSWSLSPIPSGAVVSEMDDDESARS